MEPLFAARLAGVLGKLIGFETVVDKVSSGELTGQSVTSLVRSVLDLCGERGDASQKSSMAALQCGLITHCFGHALRRQGRSADSLASQTWTLFLSKDERSREQEIQRRMARVLKPLWHLGDIQLSELELMMLGSYSGGPLETDYFQNLWKEFVIEPSEEDGSKLIDFENGGRLRFERHFLLEYWHRLALPEWQPLDYYLSQTSVVYKALLIQDVIIRDMATWNERHVFGNITKDAYPKSDSVDSIPFMSLGEMYVEPNVVKPGDAESPLVIEEIECQLFKCNKTVLVVKADFGMGKTITARKLAQRLALRFIEGKQSSPMLWAPIFIRCSSDMVLEGNELNLERTIRRAQRQQFNEASKSKHLKESDSALRSPPNNERVLFLLDGLDEVALEESALEQFFRQVESEATEHHRFVIFSRPGSLLSEQIPAGTPVLEISPLQEPQIRAWLSRWSTLKGGQGPSLEEINARGLGELSVTPILLFMIAQTWKPLGEEQQQNQSSVYEDFFQSIARGKHDATGEEHRVVTKAAIHLSKQLALRGLLNVPTHVPEERRRAEAMLWLMGRVAWEWTRREHAARLEFSHGFAPLTREDFERVLEHELGIQRSQMSETLGVIQGGLLLAMQVHFDAQGASRFLFGHKSFREFLVARYWFNQLKALTRESSQWKDLESSLLGGRLLRREDRTFKPLMELLNADPPYPGSVLGLTHEERRRVLAWAQECFASEVHAPLPSPMTLREDWRPVLREAALAIASRLRDSQGVEARDVLTLRSMLSWFWLKRIGPVIIAPRARLQRAVLAELNLRGADFRDADLTGANLSSSSMLSRRDDPTRSCDFSGARLIQAQMSRADMQRVLFVRAQLERADLSNANLMHTDFEGANLEDANLQGASLQGANLRGASLKGATFVGARYNALTQWPPGFDPSAAGARRVPEEG